MAGKAKKQVDAEIIADATAVFAQVAAAMDAALASGDFSGIAAVGAAIVPVANRDRTVAAWVRYHAATTVIAAKTPRRESARGLMAFYASGREDFGDCADEFVSAKFIVAQLWRLSPESAVIAAPPAPCSKCGGRGNLPMYAHISRGVCFSCDGSGTASGEARVKEANRNGRAARTA